MNATNELKYECTKYKNEPNNQRMYEPIIKGMNYDYERCIVHHSSYSVLSEWKIKWTNEILQWTSSFMWIETNELIHIIEL